MEKRGEGHLRFEITKNGIKLDNHEFLEYELKNYKKEVGGMSKNTIISPLKRRFFEEIITLPDDKLQIILEFVEFIKLREDQSFVRYVNTQTAQALKDAKTGKKFFTLEELQEEYAKL